MFKDILVHVESGAGARARLELAAGLADRWHAHLVGLHVRPLPHVPGFIRSEMGSSVEDLQRKWFTESVTAARTQFDDLAARAGVSREWRAEQADPADTLCLHARYADLLVVGQSNPTDTDTTDPHLTDTVALSCGRPVLVVPSKGSFKADFGRVMVAWNAGREAARAVHDALPFLRNASRVDVVAINPTGGVRGHGPIPSADICTHLARHGVAVEAEHLKTEQDVGEAILSRASDLGADLLVMGAYGRSRLREMVMGGATRSVLRELPVPALVAH